MKRGSRTRGEVQKKKKKNHLYPVPTPIVQATFFPPTPLQSPTNHSIKKKRGVKRFVHRPYLWPILEQPPVKIVLRFSCIDMNENGKFDFALRAYSRRSLPKCLNLRGNRTMKIYSKYIQM